MKTKNYVRAEKLLLQDKLKDKAQLNLIARDLMKFLSGYLEFSPDDFALFCSADDVLSLTVKLKVKSFKKIGAAVDGCD